MIHHISKLPLDYTHGITLFVFGDLQYGADGFSKEAWEEFRNQFKATKNAYALGLGDYQDFARPTMRGRLEAAASHDDSIKAQLDKMVMLEQDKLLNMMSFLEGKCVGLHEGHHCWSFSSGINSDQRIASALKSPFLGWMASTRLSLQRPNCKKPTTGHVYTIISMHGNANARRAGGALTWMENNIVSGWDADHFIMGHSCKSAAWAPGEKRRIRRAGNPGVEVTIPHCLQVGGFHSGYTDGWKSSYVERFGFAPQPLGWGVIRLKRVQSKGLANLRGLATADDQGSGVGSSISVEQFNKTPALVA